MNALSAFLLVVLVMGVVGYALSRLAGPAKRSSTSDHDQLKETSSNRTSAGENAITHTSTDNNLNTGTNAMNGIAGHSATGPNDQPSGTEQGGSGIKNQHDDIAIAELIEEVNRRLPQTQCAQCGHPGCRPYAQAIIEDHAPINQCPPGGEALIKELADFLGTDSIPLDSNKGETKPSQIAVILEDDCIGCALCIAACPVDAIVGASRYMHTVIASHCTGCELCLPPCPVDCIELRPAELPIHRWQWPKPA